jgi:methylase of polypeptide subunit release factors
MTALEIFLGKILCYILINGKIVFGNNLPRLSLSIQKLYAVRKNPGHFDVIATNPPFGSKLPIKDEETLEQYQLAHVWKERKKLSLVGRPTEQLQGSASPDESCLLNDAGNF